MPHVSVIVLFNVHNNVSKFDKVTSRTTNKDKERKKTIYEGLE